MKERWKPVFGYPGYEVSDQGRVRSTARMVWAKSSARCAGHWRGYPGKILAPGRYDTSGHVSVVLGKGQPGVPVHFLVLRAFRKARPVNREIRHLNGCASDNRLVNLAYGTRSQNIKDVFKHNGRKVNAGGVHRLRLLYSQGSTYRELAEEFNISQSHARNIALKKVYAHV